MRNDWRKALETKCFAGWPNETPAVAVREVASAENGGARLTAYEFDSQPHVRLRFYVLQPAGKAAADAVVLNVADPQAWQELLASLHGRFADVLAGEPLPEALAGAKPLEMAPKGVVLAFFAPRGVGASAWGGDEKKQTQIRRRFMLLGQTLDGMRVWDVRRAMQAVRSLDTLKDAKLLLSGSRQAGVLALYASLFEPAPADLRLDSPPANHRDGPVFLNVSRYLHLRQAAAMAAERAPLTIRCDAPAKWTYPVAVGKKLGWDAGVLVIRQ